MYAENPKQFNKTYRIQIAHTEQEIDTIIWMGVFCGDKTGFVRPGHIYVYRFLLRTFYALIATIDVNLWMLKV